MSITSSPYKGDCWLGPEIQANESLQTKENRNVFLLVSCISELVFVSYNSFCSFTDLSKADKVNIMLGFGNLSASQIGLTIAQLQKCEK